MAKKVAKKTAKKPVKKAVKKATKKVTKKITKEITEVDISPLAVLASTYKKDQSKGCIVYVETLNYGNKTAAGSTLQGTIEDITNALATLMFENPGLDKAVIGALVRYTAYQAGEIVNSKSIK